MTITTLAAMMSDAVPALALECPANRAQVIQNMLQEYLDSPQQLPVQFAQFETANANDIAMAALQAMIDNPSSLGGTERAFVRYLTGRLRSKE